MPLPQEMRLPETALSEKAYKSLLSDVSSPSMMQSLSNMSAMTPYCIPSFIIKLIMTHSGSVSLNDIYSQEVTIFSHGRFGIVSQNLYS